MANEEHGIMFPTKELLELLPDLIKGRIDNFLTALGLSHRAVKKFNFTMKSC
jgi:hypothetical protein